MKHNCPTSELSFFFLSSVSHLSLPNFGDPCVFGAGCWQNSPSISVQSRSDLILLPLWDVATIVQILFLPMTLFDGILFQLMVFILLFGIGVSCCDKSSVHSIALGSGVFGLLALLVTEFSWCLLIGGGGGIVPDMKGGGGGGILHGGA